MTSPRSDHSSMSKSQAQGQGTDLPHPAHVFAGRSFDAVLFDMDGTLINSIPITERCWGQWMVERGFPPEHYLQFHGTPARDIVAKLLPEHEREAGFQQILDMEMNDADGIIVLPGAVEALAAIPQSRRAIATSCTRDLALMRLEVTGLLMDTVVTADDVSRGKPSPDPYVLAAQRLGVAPERCLVIEDAPTGLRAGQQAGCATLAVAGTHRLAELTADAYVESLDQVRFIFDDSAGIQLTLA